MKRGKKTRRPRQRTARTLDALPGLVAFYDDSLKYSMVDGFACVMRGRPYHIGAFGTIETKVRGIADRPVVLDTRKMLGDPERVVRQDGRERCVLTVAPSNGPTIRIGLDAPRECVEDVLRKARG
jgi:hypothetical protein